MIIPSLTAHHSDASMWQNQLSTLVIGSSGNVIDYWPQSMKTIKMMWLFKWFMQRHANLPALLSILKGFKAVLKITESNALWRLTINKERYYTLYVPIHMLLVTLSVPFCNGLQRLPISKTLKEWLLFSIFGGVTFLSQTTGTFLLDDMVVSLHASPDRNGQEAKAWMIMVPTVAGLDL